MLNRYKNQKVTLKNYIVYEVVGSDTKDYLQRQLTNSLDSLKDGEGQLTSRLTRGGQIDYFFYLLRGTKSFKIIIDAVLAEQAKTDLEKFIIMEDVSLKKLELTPKIVLGPDKLEKSVFDITWCNEPCQLTFEEVSYPEMIDSDRECLEVLTGWPIYGKTVSGKNLVNDTYLNELAVSYDKGCFLGQETAGKIQSRRGAAKYPVLIECREEVQGTILKTEETKVGEILGRTFFADHFYLLVQMKREYRVVGRELSLSTESGDEFKGKVLSIGLFSDRSRTKKSATLLNKAVKIFHSESKAKAIELLDLAIKYDEENADAYELKGAILGQLERYNEALDVMDELLEVDENSVMAHTNKSLFFMKVGEIEKAEEEKALATVAGFQQLGREASVKKEQEEEKAKEEAEIKRRETMFHKVLKMDVNDEIANYGIADISFKRKEYEISYDHLQIVLKANEKYSTAYLLLGKTCEALGRNDEAVETYNNGIEIATKQGDLMPANEMQSRLNALKNSVS